MRSAILDSAHTAVDGDVKGTNSFAFFFVYHCIIQQKILNQFENYKKIYIYKLYSNQLPPTIWQKKKKNQLPTNDF